jgi:hypothetical protein
MIIVDGDERSHPSGASSRGSVVIISVQSIEDVSLKNSFRNGEAIVG